MHGRFDSQTRIRFKIVDGAFLDFFTGKLISLTPDTVGEIVLDLGGVSAGKAEQLRHEEMRLIAPAGSILVLGFSNATDHHDETFGIESLDRQSQWRRLLHRRGPDQRYAQLEILSNLVLLMRGTKRSRLLDCRLKSAFLEEECLSLNQAYTLLSMRYEPERRSHSGNVFRHGFVAQTEELVSLETIRDEREAVFQTAMYSTAKDNNEARKWVKAQLDDQPHAFKDLQMKLGRAWKGENRAEDWMLLGWLDDIKAISINGLYYPPPIEVKSA